MKSGFKIKGCYRVHLKKDGKIVGDSGWLDNTLTNVGIEKFVAHNLVAGGSSLRLGWAALGTGGAPGTATTTASWRDYVIYSEACTGFHSLFS